MAASAGLQGDPRRGAHSTPQDRSIACFTRAVRAQDAQRDVACNVSTLAGLETHRDSRLNGAICAQLLAGTIRSSRYRTPTGTADHLRTELVDSQG